MKFNMYYFDALLNYMKFEPLVYYKEWYDKFGIEPQEAHGLSVAREKRNISV